MALNAPMFQSVTAQSQEMVRQRIILEERFGRRPAQAQTPGPEYDEMIRGSAEIRDPWAPTPHENRSTIHAPVFGYSGHVPRARDAFAIQPNRWTFDVCSKDADRARILPDPSPG